MRNMEKLINRIRNEWRSSVPYSDNYGRDVIEQWVKLGINSRPSPICLDIGCGNGDDLAIVKSVSENAILYGLDIDESHFANITRFGIRAHKANLEINGLVFQNETFDLVIANQVFEHLKNWVFVLSEIARVLKPGGLLIIGVPNLASLHNRILLMLGKQPTCIPTAGMHVRGFTYPGLATVVEFRHIFRIKDCQGRVFFPFPKRVGLIMSRLWPKAASSLFLLCERCGDPVDYKDMEAIERKEELSLI